MSLTKYFLSLSMLLGLGLAANAQDWGTPTGTTGQASDKDDKDRYVTSVTTTGATEDLSYSNGSLPSSVYVYTGEGMTVERGQTVTLHVTTSEDMIWCAGMTYVDWNLDYDFDDEGESYPKVGLEVNDDGSSNLPYSGNPGIVDYTVELTVPEDAALGTTRLRLQYQDAWHNPPKGHSHSAMDEIQKGGVYDFDVTITEAAAPVEGPTLVIGEHTNGQILVYTTDGEGVQTFYENGETLPLGWITAQFVADDGYTLQTPYFGSMDLTGSLEADNTFSIEVVEGTETVSFSAVFVEEAVEPEPSGWTIVAENTMSGTSREEVVEAISTGERTIIATNFGSVNSSLTQSGVALLEGLPYCWGVASTFSKDYVGYTVAVEETGTYKFSFQSRLDQDKGASTNNATVELRYVENGGDLSYATAVSTSQTLPATTALPGTLLESNELELTAGTSYDFVVYVTSASSSGSRLFVGDFKLYKKGAAPVEEAPLLTWATPENGTIAVTVAGETVESGVEVATGTEVVATFTPAEGYELATVTLGGEDVTTDVVDGVLTFVMGEEDVELAATFAETSTPEPADNLTAIQLTGASNTSTHSMFYFSEDDYGHGAEGNFYNGRSGNLTMSVWVNIHEAQGALMGYGQRWYNPDGVFTLSFDNGYYKLRNRTATVDHTACAEPQEDVLEQAVETDTWAFVTVVFNTDNLMRYVYYNGEVVFEDVLETGGLGLLPDDCVFFVSNGVSAGWYFNSPTFDLDEVQVWDKALSADEVRASMTSVDPAAEGLISLYRFGADRMNEDYTFDNLASAGSVTAALYTGSMYSSPGSITSNVAEPTFVEGHIAEAPENYEVTWTAPENGTLTIMNGDVELTSGALVAEGTELTVIAAPASGYQLDAVTVNGETLEGTTFTVTGATVVAATFVPVQLENTLTVEAEHATVRVRDFNTLEEYSAGTVLETGTQLLVSAEAEAGYEVTSVTVNGEEWPSYEPYTVDGPVHVVATTEALSMCTVNYTFEGEEYGSMTVYDVSGFTMDPIENGGTVEVGGTVNVMVSMNDNVEGTITVNGGEPVEFDSTTWEGLYTQRIDITEDMETLDIAVVLTEAKAPENYYDFTYTIEGEELLDEITIADAMTGDPIESGASLGEGTRVGVLIYYAEGVDLTITINDVEQDIADNVAIFDGTCMYYGEITMDQDINLGIVLSQGTEPEGHTVTYALTGEAASAGTVYVNDMTDHSKLESGDTVADGADVNVQVTFDDQTVVGEMFVNGVSVGTFEYADNAGLYNYVVENVTADIDIEIELSYGNGIDSNLADGLKVYPTVFDEAVTVETPVDGSVTVYDMSGAAVYTSEVFEGSNSLPLGSLADGHYTLRVEGAGQSATVRVVKK